MNLSVSIKNLTLPNPVLVASGTFGYSKEFAPYLSLKKLGGIITKTISLNPLSGNPPPRVIETASGMLNAIGLQNEGLDAFIKDKIPYLAKIGVPIIVSIGGNSIDEYVEIAKRLDGINSVAALELNISCPNIKDKACLISQDIIATHELVKQVRAATGKVIITKLSPNVTDITSIAQAAENAGSDALSLVNTFLAMSIDVNTRKTRLGNITGGLSGPAIKPIALRMVWQVAQKVKIPIMGMGGIMDATDALEFIIAGASAVCVGTANLVDPTASLSVLKGIQEYCKKNKISDIKELVGCLNKK